jgi:hypothetical protein
MYRGIVRAEYRAEEAQQTLTPRWYCELSQPAHSFFGDCTGKELATVKLVIIRGHSNRLGCTFRSMPQTILTGMTMLYIIKGTVQKMTCHRARAIPWIRPIWGAFFPTSVLLSRRPYLGKMPKNAYTNSERRRAKWQNARTPICLRSPRLSTFPMVKRCQKLKS